MISGDGGEDVAEEVRKSESNAHGKPKKGSAASTVAFMGLLFALAMVFSFIESMLPVLPALPPGIKMGLSNIVTMYCLFLLGKRYALTMAILKAMFVLLTRGPVAALISLSGGLFSVFVMILVMLPKRIELSYLMISVLGAVAHNIGQLVMASFVIHSLFTLYYLPVMVLSGVGMGVVTGLVLRVLMPYIERLGKVILLKQG